MVNFSDNFNENKKRSSNFQNGTSSKNVILFFSWLTTNFIYSSCPQSFFSYRFLKKQKILVFAGVFFTLLLHQFLGEVLLLLPSATFKSYAGGGQDYVDSSPALNQNISCYQSTKGVPPLDEKARGFLIRPLVFLCTFRLFSNVLSKNSTLGKQNHLCISSRRFWKLIEIVTLARSSPFVIVMAIVNKTPAMHLHIFRLQLVNKRRSIENLNTPW